jgi:quercetin dioxygenase-like cupin family protein
MPLPQDINPFKMDIQDTLIRASKMPWIFGPNGMSARKVLLTLEESGTWAVLFNWKKGFVAGAHKHLSASHTFILSGKLKVRDGILEEGDYVYEPNGVLHGATEALEDTIYLFICHGPLLGFNENEFTGFSGWEQVERGRLAQLEEIKAMEEDKVSI